MIDPKYRCGDMVLTKAPLLYKGGGVFIDDIIMTKIITAHLQGESWVYRVEEFQENQGQYVTESQILKQF